METGAKHSAGEVTPPSVISEASFDDWGIFKAPPDLVICRGTPESVGSLGYRSCISGEEGDCSTRKKLDLQFSKHNYVAEEDYLNPKLFGSAMSTFSGVETGTEAERSEFPQIQLSTSITEQRESLLNKSVLLDVVDRVYSCNQSSPEDPKEMARHFSNGSLSICIDENSVQNCCCESDSDVPDDPVLCKAGLRLVSSDALLELPREDVVLCINAGGRTLAGTSLGMNFQEDFCFLGGDILRTEENIFEKEGPCVYQSARFGNFSYSVTDLLPGDYFVDLHFAEIVFTNGPPGMRVFDVFVQDEKILCELDIYARVGSNTPLVLLDARANIMEDGTLSIRFEKVIGSPIVCGICIRKAPPLPWGTKRQVGLQDPSLERNLYMIKGIEEDLNQSERVAEVRQIMNDEDYQQKTRRKTPKCMMEYERKIQALTRDYELKKNECHEAWMSLNDSNRQLEKLRSELYFKSFHMESLDQAVEGQVHELRKIQDKYQREKNLWVSSVHDLNAKIQILKRDYVILSEGAHECANSIPDINEMTSAVQALVFQCKDLKKKYIEERMERRKLYNKVLELKGNIRVFCRCRPLSAEEIAAGASSVADFEKVKDNEFSIRVGAASKKIFKFDRVFTPQDDQEDVFADTAPFVVSVLDGYNVCIFAYGQTGTGKTFTMEGTQENRGVNYRTLEELFRVANERNGQFKYDISVSVLEVYNEQIRDLLASPSPQGQTLKKLEIKQVAEGVQHVPGLVEAHVHSMNEVWDVLQTGSSARAVGSTNANEHSSRSHCILCVMVKGESLINGECTRSKLWLVDLAGSERIAKSDVQGDRLKEAQSINKSLSALGDVIFALTNKSSHVPYRNSKLTHLLQDSLGGDSKTLMFVQISPNESDAGETISSLNFATRVRGIELGPARKQLDSAELLKYKQMFEKARQEGRAKDDSIKKLEENIQSLEIKLKGREQFCKNLQEKVKELEGQFETKLKEQQQHSEKESIQYLDKLKGREQMCRNLEEKLKELEGQLEANKKEQRPPSERVSERPPIFRSFNSFRTVNEKPGFSKNQNDLMEPLTENKQRVQDNAAACNVMQQEGELLTKMESIDPEGFLQKENKRKPDDLHPKPLLRRNGRVSICTTARRTSSVAAARRISMIPLPVTRNEVSDSCTTISSSTMNEDGGGPIKEGCVEYKSGYRVQHLDIGAAPPGVKGLRTSNGLHRLHLGTHNKVQYSSPSIRGTDAQQINKRRETQMTYTDDDNAVVSSSSSGELLKVPTVDDANRFRRLSTARAWGRLPITGTVTAQRVLCGNRVGSRSSRVQDRVKEKGWTR